MAYTIESEKGKEIAKSLEVGQTYNCSDGSVWTKERDGSVTVKTTHQGQEYTYKGAYTPTPSTSGSKTTTSGGGSSSSKTSNGGTSYVSKGTYNDADLSASDKAAIQREKDAYNAAVASGNMADAQAAHDRAEEIRAKYGYSGGTDGSEYIKIPSKKENEVDNTLADNKTINSSTDAQQTAIKNAYSAWEKINKTAADNDEYRKTKTDEYDKTTKGYYDDASDYVKDTNPYDSEWAKNIMGFYKGEAKNAERSTISDATAENEGNIDSFASAHTARQYYDTLTKGVNAVNAQFLDRADRLIELADGYGVYANNSKALINEGNKDYQDYSANVLGATLNAGQGFASIAANERMNADDNATTRYQTDASERMNKDDNDTSRDVANIGATADRDVAQIERDTKNDVANIEAGAKRDVANIEREINQDNINFAREQNDDKYKAIYDTMSAFVSGGKSEGEILAMIVDEYGIDSQEYSYAKSAIKDFFSEKTSGNPGSYLA